MNASGPTFRRSDALRLYQSLGFQATHEGLKLRLSDP